jgi:hypothetical protein
MSEHLIFWFAFLCGFVCGWVLMLILWLLGGVSDGEV